MGCTAVFPADYRLDFQQDFSLKFMSIDFDLVLSCYSNLFFAYEKHLMLTLDLLELNTDRADGRTDFPRLSSDPMDEKTRCKVGEARKRYPTIDTHTLHLAVG